MGPFIGTWAVEETAKRAFSSSGTELLLMDVGDMLCICLALLLLSVLPAASFAAYMERVGLVEFCTEILRKACYTGAVRPGCITRTLLQHICIHRRR